MYCPVQAKETGFDRLYQDELRIEIALLKYMLVQKNNNNHGAACMVMWYMANM